MSDEQKRLLEKQLWAVANLLRGKMNADEYKNYILGFIFYKYLSEKIERYANDKLLVRESFTYYQVKESSKEDEYVLEAVKKASISHLGFFLKPIELFSYLVKKGNGEIKGQTTFILEDLKSVLNAIEQTSMGTSSEDDFKGLFDDVDLTSSKLGSSENKKNEVIVEVLTLLNGIDFKLEDTKSDLLGDAYEYLIGEFAAGAGKKGGEFYTPAQVSRLLSQIVTQDKKRIKSVFDPTCGSGSLLLRVKDYTEVSNYYGQELNPTTYNLARMNMILHGVYFDNFAIRQGDTLTEDMHPDLQAEAIVANPPFSAEWKGDADPALAHDERFSQYGRLAPKGAADYAFVTHMLYHLADNGTMAIVLPHGALFRSGAEGQIRKYIIEKLNYLDAVIGLPSNLFYGTSIPATVLVFKKCRKDDEDILFVDASKEFEKGKNQNHLMDENIAKIFTVYKNRCEVDQYSHKATLNEIKENDFNLNIPRYVDTYVEDQRVNLEEIAKKIVKLKKDEEKIEERIIEYCKELNLLPPLGNNIEYLFEYKKGVIQQIFTQKLFFKNKIQKSFPSWVDMPLDEVTSIPISDGPHTTPKFIKSGIPFLSVDNLVDNSIDMLNVRYISQNDNELFSKKCKPKKYDILLGKAASVGGVAIVDFETEFNVWSPIAVIRIKEIYNPYFFYYAFQTDFVKRQIKRLINNSSQENLGMGDIKRILFKVPIIEEQNKIVGFLVALDSILKLKSS